MDFFTIVRVLAVVCAGLLAGIYLGYRAGAYYALQKLGASSFVQFQQILHIYFMRFMPPLVPDRLALSPCVAFDGKRATRRIAGVLVHRGVRGRNRAHRRDDPRRERSAEQEAHDIQRGHSPERSGEDMGTLGPC